MKLGVQIGEVAVHLHELIVCGNDSDFTSSNDGCSKQGFAMFAYVAIFHVVQLARRFKFNVPGYSNQKWDICHLHDLQQHSCIDA